MLVRYRMLPTLTIEDFKSDIHKIITGQITAVADFSAGCDKANSQVLGPYPSGTYAAVNAGTYTYSKIHNEYNTVTHYFRLAFDSDKLTGFTLAAGYDSNTDTLINSQALTDETLVDRYTASISISGEFGLLSTTKTIGDRITVETPRTDLLGVLPGTRLVTTNLVSRPQTTSSQTLYNFRESSTLNIRRTAYEPQTNKMGIDFVITNKLFFISAPTSGSQLGIFDLGKSGVSREFSNSMLMCSLDLFSGICKIPYHYKYPTLSYGSMVDLPIIGERPNKRFNASGEIVIIENPAFIQQIENGNAVAVIYGLFLIPNYQIINSTVYQDSANLRRLVVYDYAILTE